MSLLNIVAPNGEAKKVLSFVSVRFLTHCRLLLYSRKLTSNQSQVNLKMWYKQILQTNASAKMNGEHGLCSPLAFCLIHRKYEVILAVEDDTVEGAERPVDLPPPPKFELGTPPQGTWRCATCYHNRFKYRHPSAQSG